MPILKALEAIHGSHAAWSADLTYRINILRDLARSGSRLAQSIRVKIEMDENGAAVDEEHRYNDTAR